MASRSIASDPPRRLKQLLQVEPAAKRDGSSFSSGLPLGRSGFQHTAGSGDSALRSSRKLRYPGSASQGGMARLLVSAVIILSRFVASGKSGPRTAPLRVADGRMRSSGTESPQYLGLAAAARAPEIQECYCSSQPHIFHHAAIPTFGDRGK